jgi:hypothetical protein
MYIIYINLSLTQKATLFNFHFVMDWTDAVKPTKNCLHGAISACRGEFKGSGAFTRKTEVSRPYVTCNGLGKFVSSRAILMYARIACIDSWAEMHCEFLIEVWFLWCSVIDVHVLRSRTASSARLPPSHSLPSPAGCRRIMGLNSSKLSRSTVSAVAQKHARTPPTNSAPAGVSFSKTNGKFLLVLFFSSTWIY